MSRVLYLGDGPKGEGNRYLASCLQAGHIPFDHVPSHQKFPSKTFARGRYRLMVLSDYPSRNISKVDALFIREHVRAGLSLLMLGGWGSFRGADGLYGRTPIQDVLPVRVSSRDDRVHGGAAYRIHQAEKHPLVSGFDFTNAPSPAGFNRVKAKPDTQTLLEVHTLAFNAGSRRYRVLKKDPFLVLGRYGRGKTGAYLSDLAPHWAGGLVDWGFRLKRLDNPLGGPVSVGPLYLRWVINLIRYFL